MEETGTARREVRQKSPNAPAYSIQECLEDVRKIFRADNQVPISRESIAEHLSLASQSGPFNRKLSSLRQYGLLEPIGKDLRVSDLYLRIDHATDEQERQRALREAIGRPTIFQGLLGQYENTGVPSDINLINQLIIKYRFTKKNAETVSKSFLESYRFTGLGQGQRFSTNALPFTPRPQTAVPLTSVDHTSQPVSPQVSPQQIAHTQASDRGDQLETFEQESPSRQNQHRQRCRQEIPLGTGRRAVLELPEDVSSQEITKIIRVLKALGDTEN